MPVYIVTVPTDPVTEVLVDAPNAASARGHVARQKLSVVVAKGPDLFRIAKAGGEMETVGTDAAIANAAAGMPSAGTEGDEAEVDQADETPDERRQRLDAEDGIEPDANAGMDMSNLVGPGSQPSKRAK